MDRTTPLRAGLAAAAACVICMPAVADGDHRGTLTSASVVGPAAQGIAVGELAGLLAAIRAGYACADVHSTTFASGEIRGQLKADDD